MFIINTTSTTTITSNSITASNTTIFTSTSITTTTTTTTISITNFKNNFGLFTQIVYTNLKNRKSLDPFQK
jgi:hypothetical protein